MAVTLEEAAATARDLMGSVDKTVTDWGDRWVFGCANCRQFGNGTAIIDKETGEDLGSLSIVGDNNAPDSYFNFDLPEGLYDEPFG
jgi:hypothetical protein